MLWYGSYGNPLEPQLGGRQEPIPQGGKHSFIAGVLSETAGAGFSGSDRSTRWSFV